MRIKIAKGASILVWDTVTLSAMPAVARRSFEAEAMEFMGETVIGINEASGQVAYMDATDVSETDANELLNG